MTEKKIADFKEACCLGIEAWESGQRDLALVASILDALCKELNGAVEGLEWRRRVEREDDVSTRENVEVRGAEGWVLFCWVDVPIGGYPVSLRVGDSLPQHVLGSSGRCSCSDSEELESALVRLLSSPSAGEFFSKIVRPAAGVVLMAR